MPGDELVENLTHNEQGGNQTDFLQHLWDDVKTAFTNIQVKSDGSLSIKTNGTKVTLGTDGIVTSEDFSTGRVKLTHPSGTVLVFDDRGEGGPPTHIITPQGRDLKANFGGGSADSLYAYQVGSGDTLERLARDLLTAGNANTRGYVPSAKEIGEAMQGLTKANNTTHRDGIRQGQILKIPRTLTDKSWL